MSNTKRATTKRTPYKWDKIKKDAQKKTAEAPARPDIPPFELELPGDSPPIIITAPDDVERQLTIMELIGPDGTFHISHTLPLLRALCGDTFPRVWALVKKDKDPNALFGLVRAIMDHYEFVMRDATEAEEDLPGGSEGSSE